jgi:hypothetical protein
MDAKAEEAANKVMGAAIEVHRLALLINFNVSVLKDGIKRVVL